MSIPYVYIDHPLTGNSGALFSLDREESFHLVRVLRLRKGDRARLTNGLGYRVDCEVTEANAAAATLMSTEDPIKVLPKSYSLHIAIAPTKHPDRLEWFIEKATEMGTDRITLILCEHSEKWNVKIQRLHRIMISAMKQSQQCRLPELQGPVEYHQFIRHSGEQEKWIGYCDGDPVLLSAAAQKGKGVLIAIGPEGDFSPGEVEEAVKSGFHPISLGTARYRTETAGLAAVMTIHTINNL
jgi:16S rRNA (uracil1498-N3)-methyltransferase